MKYILILIFFFSIQTANANQGSIELLKSLGFTPIHQDMKSFKMSDLNGNPIDLETLRGSWVLLNLWATWCGYCKKELPSLESLYLEFKNTKLKILGVSVDQGDSALVKKFIKQNNITFPIIHDFAGSISKNLDSSSVPVHYLLSPQQQIVGILRGAINWEDENVLNRLKKLIQLDKIDLSLIGNTPNPSAAGKTLNPPKIEADIQEKQLNVHLIFEDDINEYQIGVPQVTLPNQITFSNVSSTSQAQTDKTVLTYIYYLQMKDIGNYSIGPIEVKYRSIYGGDESSTSHPGFSHNFKTATNYKIIYYLLALCALIFIVTLYIFKAVVLGTETKNQISNSSLDLKKFMGELTNIRTLKISGETQEYQKKLVGLYKAVLTAISEKDTQLDQLIEEVSYAGKKLDTAETLSLEKKIDKIINEVNNDEV